MKNRKLVFISLVVMATLIVTIIGIGYAWFNATVTTSGNNSVIVDAAELGTITYYTGNEINVDGIYPGWCETKRVSIVSSNATVSNNYVINLNVVTNELKAEGFTQGYINIKSTTVAGTTGTGSLPVTDIRVTSGQIEILRGTIPANGTHTYDIEFCFPEKGSNQNSQQGKEFNAYITVEMNYFEQDSWEVIVDNVHNSKTDQYKIGDTKTITLGNGLGTHTVRIANKTTTSDCADSNTSYSQTACGFVLEFADIIVNRVMRTDSDTNVGGWPALTAEVGGMRDYLNSEQTSTSIYNSLPETLREAIIDTRVISGYEKNATNNYTTTDKLYLLSSL